MPSWTLTVENWTPPLTNAWSGRHFSRRHRLTAAAADLLGVTAFAAGVPRVCDHYKPVRHLSVTVYGWPKGRVPDPDNLLKCLLDGLVKARLLVDDSPSWLACEMPRVVRSREKRTVIVVTDVPGESA